MENMSQGHDLGTLAEQTKYSESIQNSMRVPSCISLHGGEWDQKQANKFEKIQLQTPPDTLKLDDSLYWVNNSCGLKLRGRKIVLLNY